MKRCRLIFAFHPETWTLKNIFSSVRLTCMESRKPGFRPLDPLNVIPKWSQPYSNVFKKRRNLRYKCNAPKSIAVVSKTNIHSGHTRTALNTLGVFIVSHPYNHESLTNAFIHQPPVHLLTHPFGNIPSIHRSHRSLTSLLPKSSHSPTYSFILLQLCPSATQASITLYP